MPLIRWWFAAALFAIGAGVAYTAAAAFTEGRPPSDVLELLAILAVGALPGSVIVALPTLGLGLLLLAFAASRRSGVVPSTYSAAYLCGVLGGATVFVARRSLGW